MTEIDTCGLMPIEKDDGLDGDDPMTLIINTLPPETDEEE